MNSHCGMEHTRSILQQDFWIIRSRKHLKKTIRQCIPCRRLRQKPVKPLMADLPLQRLPLSENSYPFYSTGIDFFGPFATRNNDEYSKRYVLFFTCLVMRAVHSEICQQIDTNSTLQILKMKNVILKSCYLKATNLSFRYIYVLSKKKHFFI